MGIMEEMSEQFLREQSPQYDNFWSELMSGKAPQRTDVQNPVQATQPVQAPAQAPQETRVPIGYGEDMGPPGTGDGMPRYADQQQSLMTAMQPEVQQAAEKELGPEKYQQLYQQGQQAGQQQVQQNPQVQQQVQQSASNMPTPRPEGRDFNPLQKWWHGSSNINAYNKGIKSDQTAWDSNKQMRQFSGQAQDPKVRQALQSGNPALQEWGLSQMEKDTASTNDIRNWEYGKNNPGFAKQQAAGDDNYNAKIAYNQHYANLDEPGRLLADRANRQPQILDQRTQFIDAGSGKITPKFNQEAASQEAQGAGYGKAQSDYVTGYGSMRDTEDDFISNLRETKALISEAGNTAGYKNTGWLSYLDKVPATDARTLTNLVETIQSRIAMDQMMQLKAASSTGSTGFGALSQKELSVLQDYLGKIDTKASPEVVKKQLRRVFTHMDNIEKRYDKKRTRNDKRFNMFLAKAPEDTKALYTPYGQKPAAAPSTGAPKTIKWSDM